MKRALIIASLCCSIAVAAHSVPTINTITPGNAPPGAIVTIAGSGFGTTSDNTTIRFAGADTAIAEIISIADDAIQAMVPLVSSGGYTVVVIILADTSNAIAHTVAALPAIANPVGTITAFLDSIDADYSDYIIEPPGTSVCNFLPGDSAHISLTQCKNALVMMSGDTLSPHDLLATSNDMRLKLRDLVAEMPPAQQLLFAQFIQTSGVADSIGTTSGGAARVAARELSLGERCSTNGLQADFDIAALVMGAISAALGPFAPTVSLAADIVGIGASAFSCLLNFRASDLVGLTIQPANINLGNGVCNANVQLVGSFTNGCPCLCSFSVGLIYVFIPFGRVDKQVNIDGWDASWETVGPISISISPFQALVSGTDEGTGTLTATVTCDDFVESAMATVVISQEVCDGDDDDCDSIVDDGLLCCVNGHIKDCDDGKGCTIDSCDPATGTCIHTAIDCGPTSNLCAILACAEPNGNCVEVPANEGLACDDGLACTDNDVCQSGTCTGIQKDCSHLNTSCEVFTCKEPTAICTGQVLSCGPDGDPCTQDLATCIPGLGCNPPITQCIDGDNCCPVGCTPANDTDCASAVPTTSDWGMLLTVLLLVSVGASVLVRRFPLR